MYDLKALLRGKLSDMMRAYVETKLEHPDCILFYRLGDFYEMFFDDAIEVSALLELTLTGKDCGLDEGRAPMCGVPYHAADQYIAKLVALGKKVAVCEQTENPLNKKLMTRNVVKIVTAGTVTEDETLDADSNNFIACVYCGKNKGAVAWCDITTGRFVTRKCLTTDGAASVLDALVRISPVEIICNKTFGDLASSSPLIKHSVIPKPSVTEDRNYNAAIAESLLKEQFNAATLTPYEIDGEQELISACGALVAYLRETQKHALKNVNKVELERNEEFMTLDYTAIRNLELVKNMRDGKRYGTLLWVLDKSDTPMGSRLLNEWISAPLVSVDKINYRLNGVEELFDSAVLRGGLDESLKNIRDVERLTGRVSNGNVTPADCTALAQSMNVLPALKMLLFGSKSQILRDIDDNLYDFSEIANLITKAIRSDSTEYGKNGNYI
ncbi:MAG: DNA mismatch repair protein MutS, partial [Clostridia bacterium]|nr:DNA mismatch repair protein MutS [Clostridia bacterium]